MRPPETEEGQRHCLTQLHVLPLLHDCSVWMQADTLTAHGQCDCVAPRLGQAVTCKRHSWAVCMRQRRPAPVALKTPKTSLLTTVLLLQVTTPNLHFSQALL